MSNTSFGEHEPSQVPGSAKVSVAAGFEMAVYEYENCWIAYEASKKALESAHTRVHLCRGRLEEATMSLDEIATDFNSSNADDSEFAQLVELLDIARDYMLEAGDDYDAANAELLLADDKYEADRASIDESLAIARTLRDELHTVAFIDNPAVAANDDQFISQEVLGHLSNSARHFYHCAA